MSAFIIRFLISNIFISIAIGIILAARYLCRNILTVRMQYHLWFLLPILMAIPFLPVKFGGFQFLLRTVFSRLCQFFTLSSDIAVTASASATASNMSASLDWMGEFVESVNGHIPSISGDILFGIWIAGMLIMLLFMIKSFSRLRILKKSSLPLQNPKIGRLYADCLREMKMRKNIPVRSTAFLKSPVIAGYFRPCIYLPIHVIAEYDPADIRYMLLHELQHYRHRDTLVNYLTYFMNIIYWFNPFVWYAFREMRAYRELACDASVLMMLRKDEYIAYGNTLINHAEKASLRPFHFAAGISSNMKQMKRRILSIACYEKPSMQKRLKGSIAFVMITLLLLGFAPALSAYGADTDHYQWHSVSESIYNADLSDYFGKYEGSFVLYDMEKDIWTICDTDHAVLRTAPDSTYKIYDALFGLEEGVISPENSLRTWNQTVYPFPEWNADQNLQSAMAASVNWYFQDIDKQLGSDTIRRHLRQISYGNAIISNDFSSYWMESSLKISPVEQVELLTKLYNNNLDFKPENMAAVKDALRLSSSSKGTLYGKTGTGRVDGQDISGWFIGCVESSDFTDNSGHTYVFAVNIQANADATGSQAAKITLDILSNMGIWE